MMVLVGHMQHASSVYELSSLTNGNFACLSVLTNLDTYIHVHVCQKASEILQACEMI